MRAPLLSLLVALLAAGCAPRDPAAVLAEAREAFEAGDSRTAVILVQNLLQADPADVAAHVLFARIVLDAGDPTLARTHLENARALGASPEEFAVPLANALNQLNQPAAALDALGLMSEESRAADYWVARSRALMLTSDYSGAQQALNQAARYEGDSPRLLVERARLGLARGDAAGAAALVARALDAEPGYPDAVALRGLIESASSDLEAAAADLGAAAEAYERSERLGLAAPVLLRLVQVQVALNDLDGAADTAQRLSTAIPNGAFADYANGLVAFRRGDFERTVQLLRLALTKAPDQPQFMALLGAAHLAVGNFGQAEQQFQSILAANPSDPAALRLLAETRIRQQRPQAALDALGSLEASDFEQDVGLLMLQSTAYLQSGEADEAIPYLEQAASINPGNQTVALQLARAYAETGRAAEAYRVLQSSPALTIDEAYAANVIVVLGRLQSDGPQAAGEYVQQLITEQPEEAEPRMLAAILYQLTDRKDAALENLTKALELDDTFVPAHLSLAALLVEEGRIDEAESELEAVIRLDEDNTAALLSLAQLAAQRGDLSAAETHLVKAAESSTTATPRLSLARLYAAEGDLERAKAEADRAAELSPDEGEMLVTRAIIALRGGETEEAVAMLQSAREQMPNRPSVALLLAQAQAADEDMQAARDTLAAAVEAMPSVVELKIGLGVAELRVGNADEALRIARALQIEFGRRSAGFTLEGQLAMTERRYDDATRLYRLAYERDHSWTALTNLVSASRLSSGAGQEATWLREWLAATPGDVRARLYLADLLREHGGNEEVLDAYTEILDLDPDNVVALNNAAWYAHELAQPEALDYARRAVDLAPDNAAVLDTYGWILTRDDRAEEGLPYLRSAAQNAPQGLEIRYHLAVAQAQAGQREAARATLDALLAEGQAFESRQAAEELLATL